MNTCIKTAAEISTILQSSLGLAAEVQVIHPNSENRTLYQLEHISFNRRMTMAGLERLCRRIAKALDANLYGSVNLEFGYAGTTVAMMAEVEGKVEV